MNWQVQIQCQQQNMTMVRKWTVVNKLFIWKLANIIPVWNSNISNAQMSECNTFQAWNGQ